MREMLQSINHLLRLLLDYLQYVCISFVLGVPEQDTGTPNVAPPVLSRDEVSPQPASSTPFIAAQYTISLLCCKGALLVHVQLRLHQDPEVLFWKAA